MDISEEPEGWIDPNDKYFKVIGDNSSSSCDDTDSETETETESESESSSGCSTSLKEGSIKILKGYMKNTKKYKKILFEEDFLPE
tara:strand:+ start:5806 stop:6060 length:255 start_codon:yes stop_codon:yes gene_type:complete